MGLIRKVISGSAAVATGGMSLGVVQFRSDTERNTRQIVKLRQQVANSQATGAIVGSGLDLEGSTGVIDPHTGHVGAMAGMDALATARADLGENLPDETSPGWKADPEVQGQERFWNGRLWTSKTRTV